MIAVEILRLRLRNFAIVPESLASDLEKLYEIIRFLQKAENFYCVQTYFRTHPVQCKKNSDRLTIFSTNNRKSEEFKLQSCFQIGRSSECRTKVHSCVHQIYSLHV